MKNEWDAVVIGAGPAGLAFATTAANLGLDVLAIDEQASPGGQIYRNIENQSPQSLDLLGPDYKRGASLVKEFRKSSASYLPNAIAWKIEADGRLCYSSKGTSNEIQAKRIVIAIGAMERPVPFPGWTLPGVMGVGAIDALYKNSGLVPTVPVAMVGSGPLMFSAALHLNRSGVEISHFFDTTSPSSIIKGIRHFPGALLKPGYLLKGLSMLIKAQMAAGTVKKNVTRYAAEGAGRIEELTFKRGKDTGKINTHMLLVHEGIVPRQEFVRQLNLEQVWEPVQRYWYPRTDAYGRTSEKNIYVAGDNGFVAGAVSAEKKGILAAIDIFSDLTGLGDKKKKEMVNPIISQLRRELNVRHFIDALYPPRPDLYAMEDRTIVCRCEEISAGQIRREIAQGMNTPERVKSITRCGMGPCQSRMCNNALLELVAMETKQNIETMAPLNIRPPVRNLFIGELVNMDLINHPKGK